MAAHPFAICICVCPIILAYKPVVIIHGVWDKKDSLEFMADRIRQAHPTTNVTVIDLLHGVQSLSPMWKQVEEFGAVIEQINNENPGGIHIIGYSQGGLIARGIIESLSSIRVRTFVSLSSPQGGQYGDSFLRLIFPKLVKETVYQVFYTAAGQRYSIANYWNDPHHQKKYFKHSRYLPYIDNVLPSNNSSMFKSNFARLEKLVLIGGPDDGVITPWQSSQFSFFDRNENVTLMRHRNIYTEDLFGLRSLDEKRRLVIYTFPGISHHEWHHHAGIIDHFIIPYLN